MTTKDADLLPGLPVELIWAAYAAAPGNELESGKFTEPGVIGGTRRERLWPVPRPSG